MVTYDITATSRQVGAIGAHGTHRNVFTIEAEAGDVNAAAIAEHYRRFPSLEHVRITRAEKIEVQS